MPAPKVSVLIPVYNGKPFLAECIESVLAQDFNDYELLIADDCSTDSTAAIVENYAARDKRIRWWRNQKNSDQAGNFNLCLQTSRGEFIKPLYADDIMLKAQTLGRMVAILERQPEVSLVGCASYVIDAHGDRLKYRDSLGRSGTWNGKEIIQRCFGTPGNIIGEPSLVMFRRSQSGNGFNSRYRQIVDLEFFFHLLEKGDFSYIAEPLAAWRQHDNQVTSANQRSGLSAKEELWLIQEWYSKPWLQNHASRQMLFMQIRHLQRIYGKEADELTAAMMRRLGRGWYAIYGIKRKISRHFRKLRCHIPK